jgi:hypothetical protein
MLAAPRESTIEKATDMYSNSVTSSFPQLGGAAFELFSPNP